MPYEYSSFHSREDLLDDSRKRYAWGEIEREEYQEQKLIIEDGQTS